MRFQEEDENVKSLRTTHDGRERTAIAPGELKSLRQQLLVWMLYRKELHLEIRFSLILVFVKIILYQMILNCCRIFLSLKYKQTYEWNMIG